MIGAPTRSHEPRMRDPACETRMRHGDASEHRGQFALFTRIYWDHRDFFMCVGVRGQHLLLLSGSAPCSGLQLHSGGSSWVADAHTGARTQLGG